MKGEFALQLLVVTAILSAGYPLLRAYRSAYPTSLRHTMGWAIFAWLAWLTAAGMPMVAAPTLPVHYIALCLSAAVVVAVLGARQPGMGAWNFVVVGFLATMSLPLLSQPWSHPRWQAEPVWAAVVGVIIGVGVLNYLVTRRLRWLALWFAIVAISELWPHSSKASVSISNELQMVWRCLAVAGIWGACFRFSLIATSRFPMDAVWVDFRDSYGFLWGKRVQEQFNNSAKHAGWPVRLAWSGLQITSSESTLTNDQQEEMLRTLLAVLKRFGVGKRTPEASG